MLAVDNALVRPDFRTTYPDLFSLKIQIHVACALVSCLSRSNLHSVTIGSSIDPGLSVTGYGFVELAQDDAVPRRVVGGVFRLRAKAPMAYRLAQLYDDLSAVLDELRPEVMVVEQLFSHYRHVRTAILMGHARGVVLLAGQSRGLKMDQLQPTEVKKAITGDGHATKAQMQQAVMSQCRLAILD